MKIFILDLEMLYTCTKADCRLIYGLDFLKVARSLLSRARSLELLRSRFTLSKLDL